MGFYEEFPTLQAIETKLENDIALIKDKMREVKTHPRYADNESERQYQLEQLKKEYEETLAKAEENFQVELQAIELSIAEQAFSIPSVSDDELQKAKELASVIKIQLLTAPNIDEILDLLKTRIKTMTDAEKQVVKLEIAGINLGSKNGKFKEVMTLLNDTTFIKKVRQQQEALKKIKQGADSVRRKYDMIDKVLKR